MIKAGSAVKGKVASLIAAIIFLVVSIAIIHAGHKLANRPSEVNNQSDQ